MTHLCRLGVAQIKNGFWSMEYAADTKTLWDAQGTQFGRQSAAWQCDTLVGWGQNWASESDKSVQAGRCAGQEWSLRG